MMMIVAGEASGEMYGARLVEALHKRNPALKMAGMGGPAMAAAGVEILVDTASMAIMGLVEIFGHLGTIFAARKKLITHLKEHRPQLLILIDYAEFNLMLASQAKKEGKQIKFAEDKTEMLKLLAIKKGGEAISYMLLGLLELGRICFHEIYSFRSNCFFWFWGLVRQVCLALFRYSTQVNKSHPQDDGDAAGLSAARARRSAKKNSK